MNSANIKGSVQFATTSYSKGNESGDMDYSTPLTNASGCFSIGTSSTYGILPDILSTAPRMVRGSQLTLNASTSGNIAAENRSSNIAFIMCIKF